MSDSKETSRNTFILYIYSLTIFREDRQVGFYLLLLGLSDVCGVDELHHEPLSGLLLPHQEYRPKTALADLVESLVFLHCLSLEASDRPRYSYCGKTLTDLVSIKLLHHSLDIYQDCKPKQTTSDTVVGLSRKGFNYFELSLGWIILDITRSAYKHVN